MKFTSQLKTIGWLDFHSEEEIKREIMFSKSTYDFLKGYAGPITHEFISKLNINPEDSWIFDVRVHYLKKDILPAIDAWHLDFWSPLVSPEQSPCIMAVVGDCSLPQFITSDLELSSNKLTWLKEIDNKQIETYSTKSREINLFSTWDFHRATPAINDGWRLFLRAVKTPTLMPDNAIVDQFYVWERGVTNIYERKIGRAS